MANSKFFLGNINIKGLKLGNSDVKAYLGDTLLYPLSETRLVATFNVTDTSNPTQIISQYADSPFSAIEIDGVAQPSVVSTYTFSTTGEHTVKYTLSGPTSIGNYAFYQCSGLTTIDIPNSVTSIGYAAFYECSGLTSIDMPYSLTSIGSNAFDGCSSLQSINIPSGITSIGNYTFTRCSSLTSIDIPSGVTSIGTYAFQGCRGLTSIDIPDSVTSIGNNAFQNCSGLTSITVNATTPPTLGANAFTATNNCPIYVPCDSVDTYKATSGWSSYASRIEGFGCPPVLTAKFNVTDTSSPTPIGYNQYTSGFSAIEIDGVETAVTSAYTFDTLGEHTVKYTLTDPTAIGQRAFWGCSSLTSIDIPNSVTSIGNYVFDGCSSLTRLNSNVDGVFNIPSGVTSIGNSVFNGCISLTSIDIPSGVTSIGGWTFKDCSGLTSIDISNSVTTIGTYAFSYCSSLTSIDIPSGVTSIGDYAFYYCNSLTSIVCNATTAPTIQSGTFRDVKSDGTLKVPSGSSGYNVWMGTGNYYLGMYTWTKVEQ